MPDFLDFMERANTGPMMTEKDFNMKTLIPAIRELLKEYDITLDRENPISADNALADRLFEAALALLDRTGLYCQDTNRVIQLDRREILQSVQGYAENRSVFGEGRDRRVMQPRRPDDDRLPWLHLGTGIVASSEEIAMATVAGCAGIPETCSLSTPALSHVRGMLVAGGSPLEIHAGVNSVQNSRRALGQAGRPGLPIMNLLSSSTTATGTIAATYPAFGLRPSDGWLIDVIAEMKVNYETLNRLAFVQLINGNVGSTAVPILGGYAGGAPGTALVKTAYFLVGMHVFKGAYHVTLPIHFNFGCNSMREALWVFAVTGRATSRNTRYPALAVGFAAAGPCTKMYFQEAAAIILSQIPSGYAAVQNPHPAKAVIDDGFTPMEGRFTVDFAKAIRGMQAHQANELANRILAKYEDRIATAPSGKKYPECYDIKTRKPSEEYIRLYDEVRAELSQMGIMFE